MEISEVRLQLDRLMLACEKLYHAYCLPADEPDRKLKIVFERARLDNIMNCLSSPLMVESEYVHLTRLEDLMKVCERLLRALCLPAEEPNREAKIFIARGKLQIIMEFFASMAHLPA